MSIRSLTILREKNIYVFYCFWYATNVLIILFSAKFKCCVEELKLFFLKNNGFMKHFFYLSFLFAAATIEFMSFLKIQNEIQSFNMLNFWISEKNGQRQINVKAQTNQTKKKNPTKQS